MFPGYVFIDTDFPKELYYELKNVPKLTKLLKNEEEVFLKVEEEEQTFLENIQSEGHLVRRSLVKLDEEKQIVAAEGAVGKYFAYIIKTADPEALCADPAAVSGKRPGDYPWHPA